ncbi:class I SAM-dependent methyltransferase [Mumia zhuanghuii]|uniref:Class I SAM-dependent methyltransferase n=2 Tax=Mumia TaxID=1546255 RepID=A0ABW1QGR9_9ACTN|nr:MULTISPECIES: class I SAM-dependent methyltransferase [Mumia]KAA1422913.1 class I SAM-dependent methyltransferase [Mumia zhuanghuii]
MTDDYLAVNRAMWDDRAPVHAASSAYDLRRYDDPTALSDVVRFDLPRLGDVAGLRAVHLQCHIGTDTLSLHRLGSDVVGLDLSPASLDQARALAARTGAEVHYVEGDVYDAVELLGANGFDLVFTGIGAIIWLPDIDRWARVVSDLLRPGGRLFLREGHPMLMAYDVVDGQAALAYPYFHQSEPLVFTTAETYVETDAALQELPSREWIHSLADVVTALLDHGLAVTGLAEHDSVPWDALPGLMAPHPEHRGEYRLADHPERMAASYTLQAVKQ